MRRKIFTILFALLFLVGFGILAYPTISNQWNTYRQSKLISNYKDITENTDTEDFDREWERAKGYNDSITVSQPMSADVFSEGGQEDKDSEYWNVLNIAGDGMMGYLSIPKINVELAIYHGTSDDVLQTGIGHIEGTKLRREQPHGAGGPPGTAERPAVHRFGSAGGRRPVLYPHL